jgi:hypothetical protein
MIAIRRQIRANGVHERKKLQNKKLETVKTQNKKKIDPVPNTEIRGA